jgi:thymidylate kinase
MMNAGKLYVFEGPDGAGKSTLAEWFATHLRESRIRSILLSFPGKEKGTLGKHVYELHHDLARFAIDMVAPASLQLLHVAAHIDAIENRIKPLLGDGTTVVLDRFWWSTFVYGLVAGASPAVLDRMVALERAVWDPVQPDQLFLVTRSEPLRAEPPGLWPRWREEYLRLSDAEQSNHPIVVVSNESLPEARRAILESLSL